MPYKQENEMSKQIVMFQSPELAQCPISDAPVGDPEVVVVSIA